MSDLIETAVRMVSIITACEMPNVKLKPQTPLPSVTPR